MKKNLLLIYFFLNSIYVFSQAPEWAINTGAPIHELKTDSSGNIYAYGTFENTVDFDPSPSVFNMTSNGMFDIFVVKYDPNGNFLWAFQIGGAESEAAYDIHLYNNELYLLGIFSNTLDFDPSANTNSLTTNLDVSNIFLAKYSMSDGTYNWAGAIGGNESFNINIDGFSYYYSHPVMTIDETNGDFYIGGKFEGTVDFDFTNANFTKTAQNNTEDAFISKYSNNGTLLWCQTYGSDSFDTSARGLAINNQGELLISGSVKGENVDLDPDSSEFLVTTPQYSNSGGQNFYTSRSYLLRLDSQGNFLSAILFPGGLSGSGRSITIDNEGDIYFISDLVNQSGFFDTFSSVVVYKLNQQFSILWDLYLSSGGGTGTPYTISGLKNTSDNDVVLCGFNNNSSLNTGPFLSKYDTNGYPIFGGPLQNNGFFEANIGEPSGKFTDMNILNNNSFIISGTTSSNSTTQAIDLDISESDVYELVMNDYNNFLIKYNNFVLEIDDDGDGVFNDLDDCLNTPLEEVSNVDANGCSGGDNNNNGLDDNAEISLNENPDAIISCDENNDGEEIFDLRLNQESILDSADTTSFVFKYYHSLEDAQNNNNEISNPTNYTNQTTPEIIYVRVERANNPQFFDIANFQIILVEPPSLNYAPTLVICDENNDGFAIFDLTDNESNLNNSNMYQYTYHETEMDAQAGTSAITNTISYINITNPQTIFVKAVDSDSGCTSISQFNLLASQIICQFQIPNDNFNIETLSETCIDSNNCQIIISAQEPYDYEVSLSANGIPVEIPINTFTEQITINNLDVGEYELCISIPAENYNTCYTIITVASTELSRNSSINNRTYRAELKGANKYYVKINEVLFEVLSNDETQPQIFETELFETNNTIIISTDYECKGILREYVNLNENILFSVIPNPFEHSVNISLPTVYDASEISVFDITGKLVYSKSIFESLENHKLTLSGLESGMYFLSVDTGANLFTRRIIKQ